MSDHPGTSVRYEIEIDDVAFSSFTGIEGLEFEIEVFEWTEGGNNAYVHRLPGRRKYKNIKLTRAVDRESQAISSWFTRLAQRIEPTTATVRLMDANATEIARWDLQGVWPVKYTGPSLDSGTAAVMKESIEFAHDGFTFQGGG